MKTPHFVFALLVTAAATADAATVAGRVTVAGRPRMADVVTIVYAEPLDGSRPKPGTFTLSQRNKIFSPRVLPVPAGSTVRFPNDDLIFHNVFSLSRPNPFDLGLYRAGSSQNRTFGAPAVYRVFCNIHPQMTAIVLVLPTSYYTQIGDDGSFRLEVPAGRYRLSAWSERAHLATIEVTVTEPQSTAGDLKLDESRFVVAPRLNKFGQQYASLAYDPSVDGRPR